MALCVFPPTKCVNHHHFNNKRTKLSKQQRVMTVRMTASFEEGKLERPNWAGETNLSRLVGALIGFKPLYSLLKLGARQVLIRFVTLHFIMLHLYILYLVC